MAWASGSRGGDREACSPLFLDQTEAWMTASPFTKGLDDRPPISRSGSVTMSARARYDYIYNISTDNGFDSVAVIRDFKIRDATAVRRDRK